MYPYGGAVLDSKENVTGYDIPAITSKDNKKIKDYVKLYDSKSYRDRTNSFVIEGEKLLIEAAKANVMVEMVFVSDSYIKRCPHSIEKQFQTLGISAKEIYIITLEVEKKLVSAKSPYGIYAVCKKPGNTLDLASVSSKGRYLFLCGLQDTGNVGTIIRTSHALGMDGIILSGDCCDIYNPKTLRATMGSSFRVPILTVGSVIDTVTQLNQRGVQTVATVVSSDALSLTELECKDSVVVLIGNEGNGLDEGYIKACTESVTIKMKGDANSLNAAISSCIVIWEITR